MPPSNLGRNEPRTTTVTPRSICFTRLLMNSMTWTRQRKVFYILERDRCTNIKSVGNPVTHNAHYYGAGAWMKDPLGIMGTETILVMANYESNYVVEEFENMDMFKVGVTRRKYTLPYTWDGTGGVVYGPYLYFNRANTPYIVKYNLKTEQEEARISMSGYTARNNYYAWGGYSGMDLAVDEQGLWVLWGSTGNSRRLYASTIDVVRNVITHNYALNTEQMSSMGNAFVACGVIYCIDSYNSRSTTINFAYDTKTGIQWNPNIQFTNQYTYNSMVDYNPRERVLYAWDRKRQVTYPLTFEEH
ncbi:Olfactomedin-like protein 2A [Desmophyllum pertusum]|uniref:Olfactomedin-like protein 2A n=1 Tax=Desmophyllum pertusum TaxID=174260 RepID=A0A9W9YUX4_9CNID|nr:Olfactomedin-like protein 2A [Desmophyllum pertusum]